MLAGIGRLRLAGLFRVAHVSATRRQANGGCRSMPLARARWHPARVPIAPGDSKAELNRRDRPGH
jgi:hypothetical protein